jgi:mono/diheme cytochrome c family protein
MKMILSVVAVLLTAVVGWAGMSSRSVVAETGSLNLSGPVTVSQVNAAALYGTYCAKCHGTDGQGQTKQGKLLDAQDFTDAHWKSATSLSDAEATIRDGYRDMPSYKKRLTAPQIRALAEYSKGFPH